MCVLICAGCRDLKLPNTLLTGPLETLPDEVVRPTPQDYHSHSVFGLRVVVADPGQSYDEGLLYPLLGWNA